MHAAGIASRRKDRLVRLPEGTQWIHRASIDSLPKGRAKDSPCAYGTGTMSRNTTRRSADSGGVAKSAALSAAPRLPLGDPPVRPTFARERAAIRHGVFRLRAVMRPGASVGRSRGGRGRTRSEPYSARS